MKKKLVILFLTTALICALCVPAMAENAPTFAPSGLWLDQDGSLIFADLYGKALWKQVGDSAPVQLAGGGGAKYINGPSIGGYRDGKAEESLFLTPWSVVPYRDGYAVSDTDNHVIRLVTVKDGVQTLAGTGQAGLLDGTSDQALFSRPTGLSLALDGGLFVADTNNNVIRLINRAGQVITYAGGAAGCADGNLATAQFLEPTGLFYADGALYVADSGNNRVCKIENGQVSTLAGVPQEGYTDGSVLSAQFSFPQGVAVSQGVVYVADTGNGAVRRIQSGQVSTLLAPGGLKGGLAPVSPRGLAVQGGFVYVGDVFARLILTVPLPQTVNAPTFSDVPAVYAASVEQMAERGLMNGVGEGLFAPDLLMDRGSFIVTLSRLQQSAFPGSVIEGSFVFPDMAPDDKRAPAASWAGDKEIVLGVNGKLLPERGITWAEALVMLRRYTLTVGAKAGVNGDSTQLVGFPLPPWGDDACRWGAANGLTPIGAFDYTAVLTRGEAAQLLSRCIALTGL